MKSVIFTEHARYQLKERGISKREVLAVLARPQKIIQQSTRRFRAVAKIGTQYALVIVYDKIDGDTVIVTVFKTSKLSKYL